MVYRYFELMYIWCEWWYILGSQIANRAFRDIWTLNVSANAPKLHLTWVIDPPSSKISMMLGELTVPWILIGWFLSLSQTLTDTHTLRATKCFVKFDIVFYFGKEVHKRQMEKRKLNYTRCPKIKCRVLWDYVEIFGRK